MSEPDARIAQDIATWLAATRVLAEESAAPGGGKRCCVCGSERLLTLVAPGWGGVWACKECNA